MASALRTKWYDETVKALQINGKSERTQECCARAVRMLIGHFDKEPDQISIDKHRMMIHVHRGKGAMDRYVPLPDETLPMLRRYWATHLTRKGQEDAFSVINDLMKGFDDGSDKAKFRDLMIGQGLFEQIPSGVWEKDRNVNVQAVGDSGQTIRYLSRYVFQVAISDYRIVKIEDGRVTFRYRKPGCSRDRRMTPDAMEFIRRFLQHVLPSGFMKIRYYGFLNPNSAVKPDVVRCAIELCSAFEAETPEAALEPVKPLYCPNCGGRLKYQCSILPFRMQSFEDTG